MIRSARLPHNSKPTRINNIISSSREFALLWKEVACGMWVLPSVSTIFEIVSERTWREGNFPSVHLVSPGGRLLNRQLLMLYTPLIVFEHIFRPLTNTAFPSVCVVLMGVEVKVGDAAPFCKYCWLTLWNEKRQTQQVESEEKKNVFSNLNQFSFPPSCCPPPHLTGFFPEHDSPLSSPAAYRFCDFMLYFLFTTSV